MAKLDIRAFGLACGITWGLSMFVLGMLNMILGWGGLIELAMSSVYWGYRPTIVGSIIGGIWGFLDAGIGGVIIAWFYNKFAK